MTPTAELISGMHTPLERYSTMQIPSNVCTLTSYSQFHFISIVQQSQKTRIGTTDQILTNCIVDTYAISEIDAIDMRYQRWLCDKR